jgi:hypothetical protein
MLQPKNTLRVHAATAATTAATKDLRALISGVSL